MTTTLTLDTINPYSQDFQTEINAMGVTIINILTLPNHYDVQYRGTRSALEFMIKTYWQDEELFVLID